MRMRLEVNAPKGQEEPSPGQSETKWSDTLGKMHPDGPRPTGARGNIRNAFPYEPFQRSLLPLSGRRVCRCPIPRVPLVTLALPWARFLLPLRGVYATTGKYVVRKTGEFYDNMYIQPIYKTRGKAENMGMAGRCTSMMTENDAQEKGRVLT